MCSILGFYDLSSNPKSTEYVKSFNSLMSHRGPDSQALWTSLNRQVCFGFNRLAIRDLSSSGNQPMISINKKFVLVYNGEIYSHKELFNSLNKINYKPKGSSDTELILESISHFGFENVLPKLNGMFAFSLYDIENQNLIICRDRFGIKPLYYLKKNNLFSFSSEMKPITSLDEEFVLDRNSVASFLRHGYVPSPQSIIKGILKLKPGHYIKIDKNLNLKEVEYWSAKKTIYNARLNQLADSEETVNYIENKISTAISNSLISDVPTACFLSGGIDSTLVTTFVKEILNKKIDTFCIGFNENSFDESLYARNISKYLQTTHHELIFDKTKALQIVDKIPYIFDEPFADSSQLPTIFLSEFTKTKATVAFSGDGGDEFFGGYTRYLINGKLKNKYKSFKLINNFIINLAKKILILNKNKKIYPNLKIINLLNFEKKLERLIFYLEENYMNLENYRLVLSHWQNPNNIVLNGYEYKTSVLWNDSNFLSEENALLLYLDTLTYLPDDILTKMDRSSMSCSLEVRVPLIDHNIFESAWRLPDEMKIKNNNLKLILKRILGKRMPEKLFDRPKMGFGAPIDLWLRGPLKSWAEQFINYDLIKKQGLLNADEIMIKWNSHQKKENWSYLLWNVIILQQWIKANPKIKI